MFSTSAATRWAASTGTRVSTFSLVQLSDRLVARRQVVGTGKVSATRRTPPDVQPSNPFGTGFSPDPVLSGIAVAQTVRGIQDAGVVACTKHYILNEQEHFRQAPEAQSYGYNISESSSSNVDDVTMHELYLWYDGRFLAGFLQADVAQAFR